MKILAVDPGYQGLRNAFRGTLTIVIAFLLLSFLARHWQQPATLAFVGVLIAMMSSMVVNDPTLRGQKITLLLLVFPGSLGPVLSIWLSEHPNWRLGVFFAITFCAVCLRRFGPRATALGFILFMSYFTPLFFPLSTDAIPWVLGSVAMALALSFAMRFWIFPDPPEKLLSLFLRGFQEQTEDVLRLLSEGLRDPGRDEHFTRKIRGHMERITTLILSIEQFLNTTASRRLRSGAEALQMSLFERDLNLRRLLEATSALLKNPRPEFPSRPALAQAVDLALAGKPLPPGSFHHEAVRDFISVLEQVSMNRRQPLVDPKAFEQVVQEIQEEKKTPLASSTSWTSLHLTTKQAIQATLATALASFLGTAISPQRWYWASLTAFVVFAGASRGETLTRAFLRILGTFAGLVMGFLIAYGLAGHPRLEWSAVILFIFLGLWGARFAFGFFSALAFTLMLSVLFDLMGQLTSAILILRLEETALGAVVGALISAVILPTSTRSTVRAAMAKLFRTMGDVLQDLPIATPDLSARRKLVRALRNMDRDLQAVRTSSLPIVQRWSLMKKGHLPAALHDLSTLSHYLRHLAMNSLPLDETDFRKTKESCLRLAQQFREQAQRLESDQTKHAPNPEVVVEKDVENHFLSRCQQVLAEFSKRRI
ncbi:MAG: FUSC family protein [Bdellovibrionaceae bacterium]|nr:FUSC family protein [Pseudobdellovibrionaceae bacterium]